MAKHKIRLDLALNETKNIKKTALIQNINKNLSRFLILNMILRRKNRKKKEILRKLGIKRVLIIQIMMEITLEDM